MDNVLISSFEPFGGEEVNPSQEVTSFLSDRYHTINLPVCRERAPTLLWEKVLELQPNVLLMLGEAGKSAEIALERVAINVDDFSIPDHSSSQPRGELIINDAPVAYFSTLSLYEIRNSLSLEEIPVRISNSAGTYVCNHLFYSVMRLIETHHLTMKAGFIHLPYLPIQTLPKEGVPSMPLEKMLRGVELIIESCQYRNNSMI